MQAGLDWNAWYSAEERGHDLSKSPFKKFRSNPGISLAFGKWFTPGIGLRTKIQGFWGKKVDADWNEDTNEGNGNKYWVANEQVMFNLTNLFKGYKEERVLEHDGICRCRCGPLDDLQQLCHEITVWVFIRHGRWQKRCSFSLRLV